MITDVFTRITSSALSPLGSLHERCNLHETHRSCYSKCIGARFSEGELNKGESVCVDRCVAKFFKVNKKVGEKMQAMGANAQAGGAGGGFVSL